jgi:hypothetical protein
LALAEFGLRFASPAFATRLLPLSYNLAALDQIAAGEAYVAFDPLLGWTGTPGADRRGGEIRYRHNAAGLRAERDYPAGRPDQVRRILAYGDSFTYCEEVDVEECWTTVLEEELKRSEVINLGVPGYAPDQAWLRHQREGRQLEPCAVLIGSMVENVNRVVNRFRPFYYPDTGIPLPKPRYVLEDGRAVLLPSPVQSLDQLRQPDWVESQLGPRDAWYFPAMFTASPVDPLTTLRLARTASFRQGRDGGQEWTSAWASQMYRPGGEPLEVLVAVLAGFAAEVRTQGSTPVVLIFPLRDEITAQRDEAPLTHQPLLDALRQRGVATIDLTEALGQQARRSSIGNLVVEHYRPLANRVIGRTLASQLPRLTAETCGR